MLIECVFFNLRGIYHLYACSSPYYFEASLWLLTKTAAEI
jgi:hypothetical protein